MSDVCANQASGNPDCNCTYPGCPRHGNCCQCVRHHRAKDQLPACYFSTEQEKSYDRSIAFFMSCRQG
ncbi:DUF6485 family protein [Fundidesulfovibrio terrae]|uniref:DUF6485 family protein n=1 Tax=Fundidesulfovibrio terrae TaxID=2922866 RepID=UPI001FAF05FD|nr:DUF6485 family protein [Fundidesulfovibrio terrae]